MKKEHERRKLQLSAATLRRLTRHELGRVVGGETAAEPVGTIIKTDCVDCQFSGSIGGYGGGVGN